MRPSVWLGAPQRLGLTVALCHHSMPPNLIVYLGEQYDEIQRWIGRYVGEDAQPLDHFLNRIFGEVLSQEGFGFHDDLGAAARADRLVESARRIGP